MIDQVMVPDVGEAEDVEVVEVLVAVGDNVKLDDSLVVLESDKASMEIPSPCGGVITSIAVKEGDKVGEGSLLVEVEIEASQESESGVESKPTEPQSSERKTTEAKKSETEKPEAGTDKPEKPEADTAKPEKPEVDTAEPEKTEAKTAEAPADGTNVDVSATGQKIETSRIVAVPDVGDVDEVIVVEVLVQRGDEVAEGASLVVLESDKASMEIPSDLSGIVQEIFVGEGDSVKQGDPLVTLVGHVAASDSLVDSSESTAEQAEKTAEPAKTRDAPKKPEAREGAVSSSVAESGNEKKPLSHSESSGPVHAGPAVRKEAREYGVDLSQVKGSGRSSRVLKEDVQAYVKSRLSSPASGGNTIPEIPTIDFSKWGEVETLPLSRIRKATAKNLHRSWLNVPHVTQFDEADITDLEAFRKAQNQELQSSGQKVTPLAFLILAVVDALKRYPKFNSSIANDYDHLVLKHYYNIGIAVETGDGLVVPVLKDADKKGVVQIAQECSALAGKARDGKLPLDAMQGATFTISSLGGIGGTAFTPIVNAPEVAILGVSRSKVSPVYNGEGFEPRTMLPLSLSYDHRAIDGAEAARFTDHLAKVLSDIRRVIM
ncbi:MAG: pyruvate dehydrogenase E2 component (dihydrolipoamide acetyltransferase) [Candidatus Azotimanducaceae bacterium]|jgi:pyruvate dehydrogenase E2 component (dihydrolipoamide acetyltransferase)